MEDIKNEISEEADIIAIIDADNDRKNIIDRTTKGLEIKKEKIFTFPDNESEGALEDLLKPICIKKEFFKCLESYQKCLLENSFKKLDKKRQENREIKNRK